MSFKDWVQNSVSHFSQYGMKKGFYISGCEFSSGLLSSIGSQYNYGRGIYQEDWDVLINLDGCRVDILESVSNEYEFYPTNHQNLLLLPRIHMNGI